MKQKIKFITIIFISIFILEISCSKKNDNQSGNNPTENSVLRPDASPIPHFNLEQLDGRQFSSKELKGDLALIFFNPDCDHCQREAVAIHANKNKFRGKQLYFISVDSLGAINKFRSDYHLTDENFHFSRGNVEDIVNALGPIPSVPCFYIYKDGKLIERLEGEVDVDRVASLLN
jgi:thiol-disulfide isomerase/thioredoxin